MVCQVAKKSEAVSRSFTGILRGDGTIEAYVQDASYSFTHKGLGLTKNDLGFNLFYYDGEWLVRGSGLVNQGHRAPSESDIQNILTLFGVK